MDYISQIEKLYSYFKLELELDDMRKMLEIKRNFNNDFNLFACFLKDFLILQKPSKTINDEDIYDNFILYFENNKQNAINLLEKYSKYYLMIVFEDFKDKRIELTIATVNACYAIDCYPYLMKFLDNYFEHNIDDITFDKMLQYIIDIVLDRFEYPERFSEDFSLEKEIEKLTQHKIAV